jgi:hypothetical protein
MVTYYRPEALVVERPLSRMPIAGHASFAFGQTEWHAAWWQSGG